MQITYYDTLTKNRDLDFSSGLDTNYQINLSKLTDRPHNSPV